MNANYNVNILFYFTQLRIIPHSTESTKCGSNDSKLVSFSVFSCWCPPVQQHNCMRVWISIFVEWFSHTASVYSSRCTTTTALDPLVRTSPRFTVIQVFQWLYTATFITDHKDQRWLYSHRNVWITVLIYLTTQDSTTTVLVLFYIRSIYTYSHEGITSAHTTVVSYMNEMCEL